MKRQSNDKDWILKHTSHKHYCQCVICGEIGLVPNVPKEFFNRYYMEKEFKVLALNEQGVCEECQSKIQNK